MSKLFFTSSDLSDDLLHYVDKYLKTVIINAKRRYFRSREPTHKEGRLFFSLNEFPEELGFDDPSYEQVLCQYIEVRGQKIPVFNTELADALRSLTEMQRQVLLQNVVLNISLQQLACELRLSLRMIKKHKYNAIQAIKRGMGFYDEK